MSVIDLINSRLSIYSDTDAAWRSFVLDYKKLIIKNSIIHYISPDIMALCQYSLSTYLRRISETRDFDWVIECINAIPSDVQFSGLTQLYIPSQDYMSTLYSSFKTSAKQTGFL